MTIRLDSVPSHAPDTASRLVDEQALIVRLSDNMVTVLNSVGSRIWDLADGCRSFGAIAAQMGEEFDAAPEVLERDTLAFATELLQRGLLTLKA